MSESVCVTRDGNLRIKKLRVAFPKTEEDEENLVWKKDLLPLSTLPHLFLPLARLYVFFGTGKERRSFLESFMCAHCFFFYPKDEGDAIRRAKDAKESCRHIFFRPQQVQ